MSRAVSTGLLGVTALTAILTGAGPRDSARNADPAPSRRLEQATSSNPKPAPVPTQERAQSNGAPPAAPAGGQTLAPGVALSQTTVTPKAGLRAVVLDPGHGGTDSGARGASGAVEKDMTLLFARAARTEIEKLGLRVVLTRDGDQNASFDDRATTANAQRDALFVSFHVSSTGPEGTARVYCYQFSEAQKAAEMPASAAPPSYALTDWYLAQQPETEMSRRLADLLQLQLAQTFPGSPEVSSSAPVRELRSVALPAVAVEASSVSVADPAKVAAMAPGVAQAVARAVEAFRTVYAVGKR